MFSPSSQSTTTTSPPPTLFQTYILPSRPFRRRQSSVISPISSPTFDHSSPASPITSGTSYSDSPYSYPSPSPFGSSKPRRPSLLSGHTSQLSCARCKASLALSSQIISKGFTGRHGRALLVSPSPVDTSPLPAPRSRRSSRALSTSSEVGSGGDIASRARRGSMLAREQDTHQAPRTRRTSSLTAALLSSFTSSFSSSSPSSTPPLLSVTTLPNTQVHRPVQRHLVTGLHTVSDVSCMVCGSMLGWKYIAAEEAAQRYKVGKYILETNRIVGEVAWEGECVAVDEWDEDDGGVFEFEEEDMVDDGGKVASLGAAVSGGSATRDVSQAPSTTTTTTTHPPARQRSTSIRWLDPPRPQLPSLPQTYPLDEEEGDDNNEDDEDSYSNTSSLDNAIDDDEEDIVFDSQDEDECEDLFAGVWSPTLARERRRRSRRGSGR